MTLSVEKLVELVDLFPSEDYNDRLVFIEDYKKSDLLKVLAAINCFPGNSIQIDYSKEDQLAILDWLFSDCIPDGIWAFFSQWEALHSLSPSKFPPVFHRAANLVAMEEIISTSLNGSKILSDCNDFENLLKYYLSINSVIVEQQNFNPVAGLSSLEVFIGGISATNELNQPFFIEADILRYKYLIDFLSRDSLYGSHLSDYFKSIGVSKNLYSIWALPYIINVQRAPHIMPPICIPGKKREKILMSRFSNSALTLGRPILETINVKKNPFWNLGDGTFLLLDIPFLIDKSYHSFVNDFWFNQLSPNGLKRSHFYGLIGYFFEEYVGQKFKGSHRKWKNPPVKVTDELLAKIGTQVELADVYLRGSNKVLVGQTKVSAINSKDRYTYDDGGIFKVNKHEFYKAFGLTQMVENTLDYLSSNPYLFDSSFPASGNIEVYPVLIVNERLLLSPFMNWIFQEYFIEQMKNKFGNDLKLQKHNLSDMELRGRFYIKPIVILYIAELELLQIHISKGEYRFWEIIQAHINFTNLALPMSETINRNIAYPYWFFLEHVIKPMWKKALH